MKSLLKPEYRRCPCIYCLCFPVCSQKETTFRIWDDCSLIYDFLFKVYENDCKHIVINRLIMISELFNSPWKAAIIHYAYENDLDYQKIFQNEILEL